MQNVIRSRWLIVKLFNSHVSVSFGCWSGGSNWSLHGLHEGVSLHLIYSHNKIQNTRTNLKIFNTNFILFLEKYMRILPSLMSALLHRLSDLKLCYRCCFHPGLLAKHDCLLQFCNLFKMMATIFFLWFCDLKFLIP